MNDNIKKYLDTKENKKILKIDDDHPLLETSDKYMLVIINLGDKDILKKVLEKLIFLLENEGILLINDWFDDISSKNSTYQLFNNWRQTIQTKKLIDFPITDFNQKAFIMYDSDDYEYWSD